MPVSPSEKTLEHWISQYITYRYRSHAGLWWPANGHDIALDPIRNHAGALGKTVQLELKTATHYLATPHVHYVYVDIRQLFDYSRRPRGYWPFYVFPVPNWVGDIRDDYRASLGRFPNPRATRPADLAFGRANDWWFVHRQVVVPLAKVAEALGVPIGPGATRPAKIKVAIVKTVVTPHPSGLVGGGSVVEMWTWRGGTRSRLPSAVPLQDFFSTIDRCGDPTWPLLAKVPADALPGQGAFSYRDVRNVLRSLSLSARMQKPGAYGGAPTVVGSDSSSGYGFYDLDSTADLEFDNVTDPEMHLVQVAISPSALFATPNDNMNLS